MTKTKEARIEARVRAADVLIGLLKSLPLLDRLVESGLTALQAVCGACLAYGIACALHTEQAFWAAITAIAVTQHTYADTRNLSRDQFIGAMAGGLFGFIGAFLRCRYARDPGLRDDCRRRNRYLLVCECGHRSAARGHHRDHRASGSRARSAMGRAVVQARAGRIGHGVHAALQLALHTSSEKGWRDGSETSYLPVQINPTLTLHPD
jgi:hypothetical protein